MFLRIIFTFCLSLLDYQFVKEKYEFASKKLFQITPSMIQFLKKCLLWAWQKLDGQQVMS